MERSKIQINNADVSQPHLQTLYSVVSARGERRTLTILENAEQVLWEREYDAEAVRF